MNVSRYRIIILFLVLSIFCVGAIFAAETQCDKTLSPSLGPSSDVFQELNLLQRQIHTEDDRASVLLLTKSFELKVKEIADSLKISKERVLDLVSKAFIKINKQSIKEVSKAEERTKEDFERMVGILKSFSKYSKDLEIAKQLFLQVAKSTKTVETVVSEYLKTQENIEGNVVYFSGINYFKKLEQSNYTDVIRPIVSLWVFSNEWIKTPPFNGILSNSKELKIRFNQFQLENLIFKKYTILSLVGSSIPDLVEVCLMMGTKPNSFHSDTDQPILFSYASCHVPEEYLKRLIELGCDPYEVTSRGTNILFYISEPQINLAKELIKKCPEMPLAKSTFGETALMFAGDLSIVRLLVESGADINAQNGSGSTVLHYFANRENAEITAYLKEVGADTKIKNSGGESVEDIEERIRKEKLK